MYFWQNKLVLRAMFSILNFLESLVQTKLYFPFDWIRIPAVQHCLKLELHFFSRKIIKFNKSLITIQNAINLLINLNEYPANPVPVYQF